jgi:hypothetical protein
LLHIKITNPQPASPRRHPGKRTLVVQSGASIESARVEYRRE